MATFISRHFLAAVLLMACAVGAAQAAAPISTQASPSSPTAVEAAPPPIVNRYSRLQVRLQPSARAWFQEQARAGRASTAPNLSALETAVSARFRLLPGSAAVDQGVFIVMMMMADQSARDIQSVAAQVSRLKDARQKVVGLAGDVQRERAGNPRGNPDQPCRSALCQSLPARAHDASSEAVGAGHPIRLAISGPLTYGRLAQIETQLASASADLDSFGEIEQLRLQMAMDRRSKFMETLSNILKKIETTDDSIVQNMK